MKRKLPLLVERTVAEVRSERARLAEEAHREALTRGPLSCKKGCASCCLYPVHTSVVEGLLLYRALAAKGRWTTALQTRVRGHWSRVRGLAPEVWFLAGIPCPVLDKGQCLGWGGRPMACRVTVSHGDPDQCHPHRAGVGLGIDPLPPQAVEFAGHLRRLASQSTITTPIPVSLALLLGERLALGTLSPLDVDREIASAYNGPE